MFKKAVQQQRRDDSRRSYTIAEPLEGFVRSSLQFNAIAMLHDGRPPPSESLVSLQQECARHLQALVVEAKGRGRPIFELIHKAPFEWPLALNLPPVE